MTDIDRQILKRREEQEARAGCLIFGGFFFVLAIFLLVAWITGAK